MKNKEQRKGAWALWIGVVIMFLLVIGAWSTVITIAAKQPTEQIDLSKTPAQALPDADP